MSLIKYIEYVMSDCYRVTGKSNAIAILKQIFLGETFKYLFWMRTCDLLDKSRVLKILVFPFSKFILNRYKYKLGVSLSYRAAIGYGLYLPHFGGIVINDDARIGNNCVISQNVTIGKNDGGKNPGSPNIGDQVFIGPNAVVVGGITIGDNVLIAANSFVNEDIPSNAVVVGNPSKIISMKGASNYIKRPWKILR